MMLPPPIHSRSDTRHYRRLLTGSAHPRVVLLDCPALAPPTCRAKARSTTHTHAFKPKPSHRPLQSQLLEA